MSKIRNSSKLPSTDPDRERKPYPKTSRNKGRQKGHIGTALEKVDDPDVIEPIRIDRRTLPTGRFRDVGYQVRQGFDIDIPTVVTEYCAQVLKDENGNWISLKITPQSS